MSTTSLRPELIEICSALGEIPLICSDRDQAFQRIAELGQQALGSRACTLALVNLEERWWEQVACVGFDEDYRKRMRGRRVKLGLVARGDTLDYERVARGKLIEAYNLKQDGQGIARPEVAQRYDLASALCCPLLLDDRLIGYFNHFSSRLEPFSEEEKRLIQAFARHATTTIQIIEQRERAASSERLAKLNEVMLQATEIRDVRQLLEFMLDRGLALIGCERGTISRLDYGRGELEIVAHRGQPPDLPRLPVGRGITGRVLETGKPERVDDVRNPRWVNIYVSLWPDTRSELAVPIVIPNARVRVGCEIDFAAKLVGVFNVESPTVAAFSQADEDLVVSLAHYTALLIDRLETDRKVADLDTIRQRMIGVREWDDIIEIVIQTITGTLGYDYVNISLVDRERNRIKTEYITGISKELVEEFKRLADHDLNSDDIQADIVRTRRVEVPSTDDPRFDPQIYRRFGHRELVRVYLPIIAPSDDRVIGTVETGYRRRPYRQHIYEQDVQILKGFVDYAARALEQVPHGLLDQITHELRSPVVGIRNNASFLQRRLLQPLDEVMQRKLDDILMDCEIVLHQVRELEHILSGQRDRSAKAERTLIFRDVIIKTIRQLKPMVIARGFDPNKIEYDPTDIHRIAPLYVDAAQVNQVVYNLLINAIKYAEEDPARFTIRIAIGQTRDAFVISFKDWGIGIRPEYRDLIFEAGFRTPEARQRDVNGSGLGLTISRRIMRNLGGDLRLANLAKPTEFHMILPKRLMEAPNDSDD